MHRSSRKFGKRPIKDFTTSATNAYRHVDRAASGLGRWAITDHTGFSQSLGNMPKIGFMDSCHYVATRFVIAVIGAVVAGLFVFILIAFGLPALLKAALM